MSNCKWVVDLPYSKIHSSCSYTYRQLNLEQLAQEKLAAVEELSRLSTLRTELSTKNGELEVLQESIFKTHSQEMSALTAKMEVVLVCFQRHGNLLADMNYRQNHRVRGFVWNLWRKDMKHSRQVIFQFQYKYWQLKCKKRKSDDLVLEKQSMSSHIEELMVAQQTVEGAHAEQTQLMKSKLSVLQVRIALPVSLEAFIVLALSAGVWNAGTGETECSCRVYCSQICFREAAVGTWGSPVCNLWSCFPPWQGAQGTHRDWSPPLTYLLLGQIWCFGGWKCSVKSSFRNTSTDLGGNDSSFRRNEDVLWFKDSLAWIGNSKTHWQWEGC